MGYTEMLFKTTFEFSQKNLSKRRKKFYRDRFMKSRNKAAKILNPMFEVWNEEFSKKYPNYIMVEDYTKNHLYNKFIVDKQKAKLKRFNRGRLCKIVSDEYGDLNGKIFGCVISMYLEPVKTLKN